MQIALPLGQAVPLPAGDGHGPRTLVVCAANGAMRTIPAPGQPTSQQSQACAVCLAYAAGGHLVLPGGAVLPFPPATGEALPTPPPQTSLGGMRAGLPQPRGPPAAILA